VRTRTEHLAALADVTADDIAATMDEAATEDDYYTALHSSLLAVGYPGILQAPEERPIFTRVSAARVRCGLTTSEAARTAQAREAETRLMNERAARRAG
jgi:hypothetical protein